MHRALGTTSFDGLPFDLVLRCHEKGAVGRLELILDDRTRRVPSAHDRRTAWRADHLTAMKVKHDASGRIDRRQPAEPRDMKRANPGDLNDCGLRRGGEHDGTSRGESISAGVQPPKC